MRAQACKRAYKYATSVRARMRVRVRVRVRVRACVRSCVRACVRSCVYAYADARVSLDAMVTTAKWLIRKRLMGEVADGGSG